MCHTSRRRRLLYSRRETKHAERIEATVQVNSLFFENVLLRHIYFFSLSLDATRVVLLRRRLIPETLIYISAFEPFFALDDVACAMRSRARKKTGLETGREDETHSRARGNGVRTARRRSRGAVPGRISRPLFFFLESSLLGLLRFGLVPSSSSLHEQQRSIVKSTTDVFGLLLIREKQQQRHRVYVRGVILGYKRARTNQHENTSLIKLENVPDKSSTAFYLGKKLCYVYKAHTKKQGTVYRTMWGKVTRAHGTSGVVRAKFKHNLPPSSIGGKIRCMLYPSNI